MKQNAWDFTAFTVQFAKATPTTAPAPPPPLNSGKASFGGHSWTAKWWTQGDVPGGSAGVWTDDGPCTA